MYRRGVVAIIMNQQKEILLCQLQYAPMEYIFPQGGIDEGESEEETLRRELREEIGTDDVHIIRKAKKTMRHKWTPPDLLWILAHYTSQYIGQEHRYFLVMLNHPDTPIRVDHQEFSSFKWVKREDVLNVVPLRKKEIYHQAFTDLGVMDY
jgi:putative (di)nucleoside polyphosphate hydrolase